MNKLKNSRFWINDESSIFHEFLFVGIISSSLTLIIGLFLMFLSFEYIYGILFGLTLSWIGMIIFFMILKRLKNKSFYLIFLSHSIISILFGIGGFLSIIYGINSIYNDGINALLKPINSIAYILGYTSLNLFMFLIPILRKKN